MASCSHCGGTILFGGPREGNARYCNSKCRDQAMAHIASVNLPEAFVVEKAREIHTGICPKCGVAGPIDVHTSYRVVSLLVMTFQNSVPQISCRSCGRKAQISATILSGTLGWWGFPWGFIFTPIQICKNLNRIFAASDPTHPSDELVAMVRGNLSAQLVAEDSSMAKRSVQADGRREIGGAGANPPLAPP